MAMWYRRFALFHILFCLSLLVLGVFTHLFYVLMGNWQAVTWKSTLSTSFQQNKRPLLSKNMNNFLMLRIFKFCVVSTVIGPLQWLVFYEVCVSGTRYWYIMGTDEVSNNNYSVWQILWPLCHGGCFYCDSPLGIYV